MVAKLAYQGTERSVFMRDGWHSALGDNGYFKKLQPLSEAVTNAVKKTISSPLHSVAAPKASSVSMFGIFGASQARKPAAVVAGPSNVATLRPSGPGSR